jgi:hypothetical protein
MSKPKDTIDLLKAYRESDPGFNRAIDRIVEAEVAMVTDPAEGRVIEDGKKPSSVPKP